MGLNGTVNGVPLHLQFALAGDWDYNSTSNNVLLYGMTWEIDHPIMPCFWGTSCPTGPTLLITINVLATLRNPLNISMAVTEVYVEAFLHDDDGTPWTMGGYDIPPPRLEKPLKDFYNIGTIQTTN